MPTITDASTSVDQADIHAAGVAASALEVFSESSVLVPVGAVSVSEEDERRVALRPDGPISLSQFYPFVLADPVGQPAAVRSLMRVHGLYTPAVDYWRLLRLQIVAFHAFRQPAFDALDAGLELVLPSRLDHYRQATANYRRFVSRKKIGWVGQPHACIWSAFDLQVRVNPELFVTINGIPHVVKIYLKADDSMALTQRTANPMLHLLGACHGDLGKPMVLDLLRGRVFTRTRPEVDFEPMLRAQAAALLTHWAAEAQAGIRLGEGDVSR